MSRSINSSSGSSGGVGFAGMLAIAFIVLKLSNVIDWSWWWVLSPLWIGAIISIIIVVIWIMLDRSGY